MDKNEKNGLLAKSKKFFTRQIWDTPIAELHGAKKWGTIFLRAVISTVQGIIKNRIAVQASSLSYATLLATGPILAIVIIFSTMFFRDKGENFIYEKIMDAVVFVMPAMNEMMQHQEIFDADASAMTPAPSPSSNSTDSSATNLSSQNKPDAAKNAGEAKGEKTSTTQKMSEEGSKKINPAVKAFIGQILRGSSSAGALGVVAMLFTCLLLCINMESSLNFIWGVSKGRGWINRIVFYFAMIFFGSVGTMFGMTFLATSHFASAISGIPIVAEYASWVTYILGMFAMTCVLAFFYKYIPCARVKWMSAFVGAFVVLLILMANNKLSFLYISYIGKQNSLYGYFAIVVVAMFSLYIFWFVILAGGLITYVVQYIDFISDDDSWNKIGSRTRALIDLAVFSEVSKNFINGDKNSTLVSISRKLRLSESIAQSAMSELIKKELVCKTEGAVSEEDGEVYFKPNFSPDGITVGEFFNRVGSNSDDFQIRDVLVHEVNSVSVVMKSYDEFASAGVGSKSIREIL